VSTKALTLAVALSIASTRRMPGTAEAVPYVSDG
jgi:hypothetical protein